MTNQVVFVVEVAVPEAQQDTYRQQAQSLVASTRENEPGVLSFNVFLDGDGNGSTFYWIEWYDSAETMTAHMMAASASAPGQKLLELGKINRFDIFGQVPDPLRSQLEGLGAHFYTRFIGFTRPAA
jgi:quinol monooxygenase YgiN